MSNEVIKEQLQFGMPVIYRSLGWSLYPRIWPNDECTYEPVTSADDVNENDIVFCQVQPGDRFYGHLVSCKWFQDGEWYFTISNLKGAVKRLVRHQAHVRPIDPMPALISTALHNLCTCASIKKNSAPSEI